MEETTDDNADFDEKYGGLIGPDGYIDYDAIAHNVEALKTANQRIDELQTEIDNLDSDLVLATNVWTPSAQRKAPIKEVEIQAYMLLILRFLNKNASAEAVHSGGPAREDRGYARTLHRRGPAKLRKVKFSFGYLKDDLI